MDIKAYQALLDRHERLDECPDSDLSEDDRRSLIFYRAEAQFLKVRHIDEVQAPTPVRKWIHNVTLLDDFDLRYGRPPHKHQGSQRDSIAQEENRLAEWVSHRRDTWETLCSYQRERLLCIPSFELDQHGKWWDDQFERYAKVVDKAGHAPVVTSADAEERISARWAARVRAARRKGLLAKHRSDEVAGLRFWWWEK